MSTLPSNTATQLVAPKNGFLTILTKGKIVDEIKSLLGSTVISDAEKFEPAILEFIMNKVENYLSANTPSNGKVDKKQLVIQVLQKFVTLNPTEIAIIDRIIEYIHSISRVKKVSTAKIVKNAVVSVATNLVSSSGNASS